MAYPYEIDSVGYWPGVATSRIGNYGPFFVSGNIRYVCAIKADGSNFRLTVWKSGDVGVTWAEQDFANGPLVFEPDAGFDDGGCFPFESGTDLIVGYMSFGGSLGVVVFDSTTDAWGTPDETGPTPDPQGTGQYAVYLAHARPSVPDILFIYSTTPETVSGDECFRISQVSFDFSLWSTPALVTGQTGNHVTYSIQAFPATARTSADRIHLFFSYYDFTSPYIGHVSFETDNSNGSISAFLANDGYTGTAVCDDSDVVYCSYKDGATGKAAIVYGADASSPIFSSVISSTVTLVIGQWQALALAVKNNVVYLFAILTGFSSIRWYTFSGTFSAESNIFNGTVAAVSAIGFGSDIGIVANFNYLSAAPIAYFEFGQTIPPTTGRNRCRFRGI